MARLWSFDRIARSLPWGGQAKARRDTLAPQLLRRSSSIAFRKKAMRSLVRLLMDSHILRAAVVGFCQGCNSRIRFTHPEEVSGLRDMLGDNSASVTDRVRLASCCVSLLPLCG